MTKKLTLEEHAAEIRRELNVPRQSDVFRAAVEAGYLAARADGEVDPVELDTIVRQSEESERVVREMEALLRADAGGLSIDVSAPPAPRTRTAGSSRASGSERVKRR